MKSSKLFLLTALLLVSMTGLSEAFFGAVSPEATNGQANVTIPVFNNSSGTLDAGDVVILDVDASTGDNDMYVTTTTTADTNLVVGVVWPSSILDQTDGSVVVYGMAECDVNSLGSAENGPLCTSTTAGAGRPCTSVALESNKYAVAVAAIGASSQGKCFVNP